MQEEVQREGHTHGSVTENAAMHVKINKYKFRNTSSPGTRKPSTNNDSYISCDYCRLSGHTQDKCFCLHGYPEWHRLFGHPIPKSRTQPSSKTQSPFSDKQTTQVASMSPPAVAMSSTNVNPAGFTDSQCQQIANMIQASLKSLPPWQSNHLSTTPLAGPSSALLQVTPFCSVSSVYTLQSLSTSSKFEWILDSGATDHIMCQFDLS